MNAGDRAPKACDKDEKKSGCDVCGRCKSCQSREGMENRVAAARIAATISDARFWDRAGNLVAESLREQDALLDAFRNDLKWLHVDGKGELESFTQGAPEEHERAGDGAGRITSVMSVRAWDWTALPSLQGGSKVFGGAAPQGASPESRLPGATAGVEGCLPTAAAERGCKTEGCVRSDQAAVSAGEASVTTRAVGFHWPSRLSKA
ncbi:unnamed protein product [Ostreobium quekettii]|uniref:Uncharacterized protein n=1 Tax=Ostreobium quekettii TaxID=121088 RepID=A0A8S1J8Z6_9CHLO|nr:unnamed protein product [Ostreobium quekettii]